MFTQWVKLEQTAHIGFRLSSVARVFTKVSQLFQRSGDLQLQALPLKEEPLVKGWAIREGKTIQPRTTHEIHSPGHARGYGMPRSGFERELHPFRTCQGD